MCFTPSKKNSQVVNNKTTLSQNSNQINQRMKPNILLLFMLAYQSKNDDEDKNDGDGDKENEVGRHGPLI